MTTPPQHPDDAQLETLPGDLMPIAAALDRLAAADRAAMPSDLINRIAGATAPKLLTREHAHLDALSSSDRTAAPSTLEDRVFMATRGIINRAPAATAPRVHEPRDRGARRFVLVGRLATAAALLLGVGVALQALRTETPGTTAAPVQIASAIQDDLDELALVIDAGDARAAVSGLNVALRTVEDDLDDDLLRAGLDDGGSL